MTNLQEIAIDLYQIGAIRIGSFTLKSGDVSPYYLDLRLIPSHPALFKKVIDLYCQVLDRLGSSPKAIAGIMSAGIPFATGVCLERDMNLLQVRSEAKEHGTKKLVEGTIPPQGTEVVLLDDLISTGASKLHPFETLKSLGLEVSDLIVLIDRTASDQVRVELSEHGLRLHAAGTPEDLFQGLLKHKGKVSPDDLRIIQESLIAWQN